MNEAGEPVQITDTDRESAREYSLDMLQAEERATFEHRLADDIGLREEVLRWRAHFSALGMAVEDKDENATVLGHLKRELWSENRLPWRRRIRIWEFALGGVAAAMVAFAVIRLGDAQVQGPPILQAQIVSKARDVTFGLALRRDTGLLQIERDGDVAAAGKAFVLWSYDAEDAPGFVGVLPNPPVGALRIEGETLEQLNVNVRVAVSEEAIGAKSYVVPSAEIIGLSRLLETNAQ